MKRKSMKGILKRFMKLLSSQMNKNTKVEATIAKTKLITGH